METLYGLGFFLGAGIFALMSLLGGPAQSEAWLIASRAVMGVGGTLMWPAILGMTYGALLAAKAGLADGPILGVAGLGKALGPMLGGALTEFLSWRWILFLNIPITALAVTVVWMYIHQPKPDTANRRIDYGGIVSVECRSLTHRRGSPGPEQDLQGQTLQEGSPSRFGSRQDAALFGRSRR